jgi:hypothetical protein
MARSKKPAQAGIGDNSKSQLAGFVEDFHRLDRNDLFEKGAVLIRAHDTGEYQDWEEVCRKEFDISHDTARNLMAVAKVAESHENFRELRVRPSTLYRLAGIYIPEGPDRQQGSADHKNLPMIIAALAAAAEAAGRTLSVKAAHDVIKYTRLRKKFGADLPNATLIALDDIDTETDWGNKAAKQLKKDKPETKEAADAIVNAHHRAHVAEIFKVQVEALPAWLNEEQMLTDMEKVQAQLRKKLLKKLQGPEAETAYNYISEVLNEIEEEKEAAEEQGEQNKPKPAKTEPAKTEPAKAEDEEGDANEDEDEDKGAAGEKPSYRELEFKITGLESEIEELKITRTLPALIEMLAEQLRYAPVRERVKAVRDLVDKAGLKDCVVISHDKNDVVIDHKEAEEPKTEAADRWQESA